MATRLGKRPGSEGPSSGTESDSRQRVCIVPAGNYVACMELTRFGVKRARVSKESVNLLTPEDMVRTIVAMEVVQRFMRKFVVSWRVTRTLALKTMTPSPTAASVEVSTLLGHTDYIKRASSPATIKAMQRLVCSSGLFDKAVFAPVKSWTLAGNLVCCFDVCGHPRDHQGVGVLELPGLEMIRTATVLCTSITYYRSLILDGIYPWGVTPAHPAERLVERTSIANACRILHSQYTEFAAALVGWRRASAVGFKEMIKIVLFNLYDADAVMKEAIECSAKGCVRKPYLQHELIRYADNIRSTEKRLVKKKTFEGVDMLKEIKDEYFALYGRRQEMPIKPSTEKQASVAIGSVMHTIVDELRSTGVYTLAAVHHESVVNQSFQVKWARRQVDDDCLAKASTLMDRGHLDNIRREMAVDGDTVPIYRYIQMLITNLREHLVWLGLRSQREFVLEWLNDARWQSAIDIEGLTWNDIFTMLKTSVRAMQFSVGSADAVFVMYKKRVHDRSRAKLATTDVYSRLVGATGPQTKCSDVVRTFDSRPGAYAQLLQMTAAKARGNGGDNGFIVGTPGSVFDVFDESSDNQRFGLAPDTYNTLVKNVVGMFHEDKRCTSCELANLTVDALIGINKTLCTLDVDLANAEISLKRSYTHEDNIDKEQTSFDTWFARGLRTDNTLAWLRRETDATTREKSLRDFSDAYVHRMVFNGYVSLITGDAMLHLEEGLYPETLLLDIAHIQEARSVFYGHVIQTSVLVIIGKRLTDMRVPACIIKECTYRVSLEPAFTVFSAPDTLRAATDTIKSMQDGIRNVLTSVVPGQTNNFESLLRELAREASHAGYPTTPIASHIARKWATAMRMGLDTADNGPENNEIDKNEAAGIDERGEIDTSYTETLNAVFRRPHDTRAAFCSELLLPQAAVYLSNELHSSVTTLVARTWFNTAVHLGRYKSLLSQV
jgi:hypothetical protein